MKLDHHFRTGNWWYKHTTHYYILETTFTLLSKCAFPEAVTYTGMKGGWNNYRTRQQRKVDYENLPLLVCTLSRLPRPKMIYQVITI